jgi:hypothetical protein
LPAHSLRRHALNQETGQRQPAFLYVGHINEVAGGSNSIAFHIAQRDAKLIGSGSLYRNSDGVHEPALQRPLVAVGRQRHRIAAVVPIGNLPVLTEGDRQDLQLRDALSVRLRFERQLVGVDVHVRLHDRPELLDLPEEGGQAEMDIAAAER